MRAIVGLLTVLVLAACDSPSSDQAEIKLDQTDIVSGSAFLTPETRALQDDDFANPGFLWVERGADLFAQSSVAGPACETCHSDGLAGVAATYPAYDANLDRVINLEGRINQCRIKHQGETALPYESDALLSLTAYVANQSNGYPHTVDISGPARSAYEAGAEYFRTRRGQFNLSCVQCHTENWGKRLRGDTLSQGHGNGFPAYRLEWQSLGSLHRRLRDCDSGVHAEPLPFGDPLYVAVELFLAARSDGLELENPAIRR